MEIIYQTYKKCRVKITENLNIVDTHIGMIRGIRPYHRSKSVLYRGGGLSFDFNNNNKLILNTENGLDNLLFVRGHT